MLNFPGISLKSPFLIYLWAYHRLMYTLRQFYRIYKALPGQYRRSLIMLQIIILIGAIVELIGVSSIVPFVMLVANPDKVMKYDIAVRFFSYLNLDTPDQRMWFVGILTALLFLFSNMFRLGEKRYTLMVSARITSYMTRALLRYYLGKNYIFHTQNNSANIREKIFGHLRWLCRAMESFLMMNSNVFTSVCICSLLAYANPWLGICSALVFAAFYLSIYRLIRKRLVMYSQRRADASLESAQVIAEAFNGIVDVKIFGRETQFENSICRGRDELVFSEARVGFLGITPKFLIESIAMIVIVIMIMVTTKMYGNFTDATGVLALYTGGAFRALPAIQGIFLNVTTIKNNIAPLHGLIGDVLASLREFGVSEEIRENGESLDFSRNFTFEDVSFSYNPNKKVLKNIAFTIKPNTTVGFAGHSGSGKSTAVMLILGLLEPDEGRILIDGQEMTKYNRRLWQNKIGYVPQMIYIADTTIAENIAFGVELDQQKLEKAAKLAELSSFINNLPNAYNTIVGENGVQLSGGQRQRLGIARALYNNPEVIVFDEATSALDGITEDNIIAAINNIGHSKTVVMIAHRLTTLKDCDVIYFFNEGEITSSGTYPELLKNNKEFRNMAKVH